MVAFCSSIKIGIYPSLCFFVSRGLGISINLLTFSQVNLSFLLGLFLCFCNTILFPWLFLSSRVAGMTAGLPTPCRPVHILASCQSSTFQISLARVFPSCFLFVLSSFSLVHSVLRTLIIIIIIFFSIVPFQQHRCSCCCTV